ncbi:MAG: hypothetical protein NTW08_00435, partial [Gammaproteobacteria bacterium]|nr:hypothetical protein [Gammaproteobacteria bacterium]
VRSWVVYYQNQHLIPEDRIQQLFMDMYKLPIATASIATFNKVAYEQYAIIFIAIKVKIEYIAINDGVHRCMALSDH